MRYESSSYFIRPTRPVGRIARSRATLSAAFVTMKEAAATVQSILESGFLPAALEIADHFTLEAARRDRGNAHVPAGNAHLLVEVDGQEETVRQEAMMLQHLIAQ